MTTQDKLLALIEKAIDSGFEPIGDPKTIAENCLTKLGGWHVNQIIFNHDFAKALFGEHEAHKLPVDEMLIIPQSCDGDCWAQAHFSGPVWQYHLQQAVISEDPISYMYEAVFGKGRH